MKKRKSSLVLILLLLTACANKDDLSDAYGNFESIPVLVSSESQGRILVLEVEEGQRLEVNERVGMIDTVPLHLKKLQLIASIRASSSKAISLEAQVKAQQVQLRNLEREYERIIALLTDGAATNKQRDDLEGSMEVMRAQIESMDTQFGTIDAEKKMLGIQVRQVDDQIQRASILNPVEGVVLQKYKQAGEIMAPGQPIYKIASLDTLILRAYISGSQLSAVTIGQQVRVRYDTSDTVSEIKGTVSWIASQAEFTPKIIQTREERVNLVYAIKVRVANDGSLKIGMPGEVKF